MAPRSYYTLSQAARRYGISRFTLLGATKMFESGKAGGLAFTRMQKRTARGGSRYGETRIVSDHAVETWLEERRNGQCLSVNLQRIHARKARQGAGAPQTH